MCCWPRRPAAVLGAHGNLVLYSVAARFWARAPSKWTFHFAALRKGEEIVKVVSKSAQDDQSPCCARVMMTKQNA